MKYLIFFILAIPLNSFAQEEDEVLKHKVGGLISHTRVPFSFEGEDNSWGTFASFGLFYDYNLSEKWAFGVRADVILESFVIERSDTDEILERKRPIGIMGVFLYEFENGLSPLIGGGIELEENEPLALLHAALVYNYPIANSWQIFGDLGVEHRIDAYTSWTLGLGISKRLSFNN